MFPAICTGILFLIGWILRLQFVHEYGKIQARNPELFSRDHQFLTLNLASGAVFTEASLGSMIPDFLKDDSLVLISGLSGSKDLEEETCSLTGYYGGQAYDSSQSCQTFFTAEDCLWIPQISSKKTWGRIQSEELIAIKCSRPNNPGFLGGDFSYSRIIHSCRKCWLTGSNNH
jgi:hypothetical protein